MNVDRSAWHEWRRNGIGASDVAAILGESPWASPWSVWTTKVGLVEPRDDDTTDPQQFGLDLEPVIAAWFTRETSLEVHGEQTQATAPGSWSWARATLDGFVFDPGDDDGSLDSAHGVFESKYTADAPWAELPRHYVLQVQWQLFVTGFERAWLACMHLPFGRPTFRVYEVERDDALIADVSQRCAAFWRDHVVAGDPPPVDAHPATTAALVEVYDQPTGDRSDVVELTPDVEQAVAIRTTLKARAKEIDDELAEVDNVIRAALGDRTEGVNAAGQLVVSWRQQSSRRLDTKALGARYPELVEEFTNDRPVRVMRTHKPKGKK